MDEWGSTTLPVKQKNPHTFAIVSLRSADLLGEEALGAERHTGCSSNTIRPTCDNILIPLASVNYC